MQMAGADLRLVGVAASGLSPNPTGPWRISLRFSSALECQLNQHSARGERFLSIELAFQ
jgi:hypothetical protein